MITSAIITLLRKHVPTDGIRPFVCNGDPMKMDIFIVGHNPRNSKVEFWKYWSDTDGFSKVDFERDYLLGKRIFRGTRLRLNRISDSLKKEGMGVLETNLYWQPSDWLDDLKERSPEPFIELVAVVKPSIIIVHGKEACRRIDSAMQQAGIAPVILRQDHFMRVSFDKIDALIHQVCLLKTEANQSLQTTTMAVTDRAPSSMLRAKHPCGSP